MYKPLLVLFLIVVVVNSQIDGSTSRTDDYININRKQHTSNIKDYDFQIETFKENYAARIDTIDIQLDMLEDTLIQSDIRLNPLELLSDLSNQCVGKYRSLIPTLESVKATITNCITAAVNQITILVTNPLTTRNALEYYYSYNFETDITNCNKTYGSSPSQYNTCVANVFSTTDAYTRSNQKTFASQMDASQYTSNAHTKKALECSFSSHNRTISLTAQANTLINRCLQGLDDCRPCNQKYSCSDVKYIPQVNYYSSEMTNPFMGRYEVTDCLMLKIY